ncbi:Ig domain OX-2-like protein [Lumpy skin disease virus]|uniref:Ig domain OX-2-like protein n=1 Tax=Lumpy skin disease virus TaxID=59509 RepID=A0A1C9HHJ8_LSDV|nr:Ig domain OX-2-like protein [Lumpy skin disease virus]AOO78699.1 Ig domain OX-2-like protein [Lumpy skin disease virus]AOO78857.1 Ig domain OX-2-like protein [Lumpy skin disease virus]AOO79016.1 Ig domain OX-2-like protein [Lumpy skin disease virus]AVR51576.1 Ig domain OX-2-like protein [Lumpy skin disease virus]
MNKINNIFKLIWISNYINVILSATCISKIYSSFKENTVKISCNKTSKFNSIIITWKKNNETIATYGPHGSYVVDDYKNKIEYISKSFNYSTIIIKNATIKDNSCYTCIFNILLSENDKGTLCLNTTNDEYINNLIPIKINENNNHIKNNIIVDDYGTTESLFSLYGTLCLCLWIYMYYVDTVRFFL